MDDNAWQTIETAPKEGYLLLCDRRIEIGLPLMIGYWDDGWIIQFSPRRQPEFKPTHWMRLPVAPKREGWMALPVAPKRED